VVKKSSFSKHSGSNSVLLIYYAGKHVTAIISKGTTGKIQLLDVYGFRIWKNLLKDFQILFYYWKVI